MKITRDNIEQASWEYAAHYNMGKLGYGYGHRCEQEPRLSFIDRAYKPSREHPDGLNEREWYVDGASTGKESAGLTAALAALLVPPVLTDDEKRILEMVPTDFVGLRALENELAGVPKPAGGVMPDTPHSRVSRWLSSLVDKGMVEYGRQPERSDGEPWSAFVPEHLRWSPTIRRRPQT